MPTLTIDGIKVTVEAGSTILDACKKMGIDVPTLCYHEDQDIKAICRICCVEIEGQKTFQAACSFPVAENMVVKTNTPAVREARRVNIEMILAHHPQDCLQCPRNLNCELQTLAEKMGIREVRFERGLREYPKETSNPSIVRDPTKCIACRRCVYACHDVQGAGVIYPVDRGYDTTVTTFFEKPLTEVACTFCGQCIHACPVGAIYEKEYIDEVWAAINDPQKHVVVQTAPAVRVSLGEEVGMAPGSIVTGKMVAALRRLGFDAVFDTDFTADLTIIEEGNELIHRVKNGGVLPMITSCSPGWINFIEHYYPELLPHLSTCKSPQQMFGALAKTFYSEKTGINPANIVVVSIMPCTAKKFEAARPEMKSSGFQDVDYVLTTRELGRMIREAGINFNALPLEEFDPPLGISTGAAAIFGATGGVMEAALRTVYEVLAGEEMPSLDITAVRGLEGVKAAEIDIAGLKVKAAVAHSLGHAKKVLDQVKAGKADYHFIEIMCCPGGCIGGGGQSIPTTMAKRAERIKAIYEVDRDMPIRKSHENPAIKALYAEFLKEPLGHKSHELLHTHYTPKSRWE
jgi:NADH-quinone oxidoreductase subunit G/NADP-reducing hydrogenase subunit HndD